MLGSYIFLHYVFLHSSDDDDDVCVYALLIFHLHKTFYWTLMGQAIPSQIDCSIPINYMLEQLKLQSVFCFHCFILPINIYGILTIPCSLPFTHSISICVAMVFVFGETLLTSTLFHSFLCMTFRIWSELLINNHSWRENWLGNVLSIIIDFHISILYYLKIRCHWIRSGMIMTDIIYRGVLVLSLNRSFASVIRMGHFTRSRNRESMFQKCISTKTIFLLVSVYLVNLSWHFCMGFRCSNISLVGRL